MTAEKQRAEIERSGKRWAGVIVALVVGFAIFATTRVGHEATPEEERGDAQRACQETFVPARLKAPATADYSAVSATGGSGRYTVTGSVDSQNSFGALVRSSFTCSVHLSGDQWILDSASVTG